MLAQTALQRAEVDECAYESGEDGADAAATCAPLTPAPGNKRPRNPQLTLPAAGPTPTSTHVPLALPLSPRNQMPLHQRTHSLACSKCDKTFTHPANRQRHELLHAGVRRFQCEQCDRAFTRKEHFVTHVRQRHLTADTRPFRCRSCTRTFNSEALFSVHVCRLTLPRGDSTKPHPCPDCTQVCPTELSLLKHRRLHTGERAFTCAHAGCERTFSKQSNADSHFLTAHTSERPFTCTYPGCASAYADRRNLVDHAYSHNEQRPHRCTHPGCGQSFDRPGVLAAHSRRHTGACADAGTGAAIVTSTFAVAVTGAALNE